MHLIIYLTGIQPATRTILRKELILQKTKLLLKMIISNLKKTWTITVLFEFGLAKSDKNQLPWPKVSFKYDFLFFTRWVNNERKQYTNHLYFMFLIILKSTLLYSVSQNTLRSWWQQPLGNSWDLQCQNGAMTHTSTKTKSRRQQALFLWPVQLMLWISNLFLHLIKLIYFQKHDDLLTGA